MRKAIVVFGVGGTSRDVIDALEARNLVRPEWNILGFLDDNPALHGKEYYGYQVLGASNRVREPGFENVHIVMGVGNDRQLLVRRNIRDRLDVDPSRFPSVIHPSAYISPKASIGLGSVILSGSFCAGNARIGNYVVILQNTVVGHDCEIGDFVSMSATVSMGGGSKVGQGAYVGMGSSLLPGIRVGVQARVGIGSVVIRDVPDGATVFGNPARVVLAPER
jgi:sugar O-acyltransferase (sialic acid O-acetyltransferase NeuD family)